MRVVRRLGDVGRYALGAGAGWLVFPIEAAVAYVVLLVVAMVTGADPGGPLAAPLMILVAAVVGIVVTALVLFPAVLVGDVVMRHHRVLAPLISMPVAALLLTAGVWVWLWADVGAGRTDVLVVWAVLGAFSVIPLGVFIGVTHGSGVLLTAWDRRRAGRTSRRTADGKDAGRGQYTAGSTTSVPASASSTAIGPRGTASDPTA